jgi:porphobilinogen synthase
MEEKPGMNQRRYRANPGIRALSALPMPEPSRFIQPVFVEENLVGKRLLQNLPGIAVDSVQTIFTTLEQDFRAGISHFLLFPIPAAKSDKPDLSWFTSLLQGLKSHFGERVWLACDLCLCAFTHNGHCGILSDDGTRVLNEETCIALAETGLAFARAGADCIAPSDMMDGRIAAIRKRLDENGFGHLAIMSYAAKFQSVFYGPFRDACGSSPGANPVLKDRKTYQIHPLNLKDALACAARDADEGADILMVKPAGMYLDVIQQISQTAQKPVAAYHVSGEYASLELLVAAGLATREAAHLELWFALQRAGATIIISYAARHAKTWLEHYRF